ncbi:MAG TPA: hypothetical protein VGN26_06600 [Armatimonadota bacterium]|jgi:hypothetical protein
MKRFALLITLFCAVVCACAGPLAAQDNVPVPRWAVKAGGFFPIDSSLRKSTSSAWILFGADYAIRRNAGGEVTGTIEYTRKSGSDIIALQGIWKRTMSGANPWYWGLGPGLYITSIQSHDTSKFGIPFLVGIDLNRNWFGEAKFNWVMGDIAPGTNASNFTVSIGYRI